MTEPLIFNNFDQGVADSPHKGFGLMKLLDLEAFPGAVKVGKVPTTVFHTALVATFTADPVTDICTMSGSVPATGTAVVLTTTGTLPAGLSLATNYFIIQLSGSTFKLATTITLADAGTGINITDAGTGVHTVTTVNPGTVLHIIRDPRAGTLFYHDSNGRVWFSDGGTAQLLNGNLLTNAAGNGLGILWNSNDSAMYLFVFRNALLDVINVYGTSQKKTPVWTSGWQSLNSGAGSGNRHHAITGQDAIIYFTDSRYVGSIMERVGQVFDPASSATYTFNNQALDTPLGEALTHLEELGTNLLAAGGASNKIYPWDRVSDSFNLPIPVPEIGVYRMKNIGNIVYILAGTLGNVYATQGSYARLFRKIPDQMSNNSSTLQSNVVTWGGIDAVTGALLFGAGVLTSGNSGAYLLYPDGRLVLDNIPSVGSTNVTAFNVQNQFYTFGYASGADNFNSVSRYSNFEAVLQSAFRKVATLTGKGTYSVCEVIIAKPVATGHVRVKYRIDTSSAFSDFSTAVLCTADGVSTTFKFDIGIIDIENIQIQVELDGLVELVEIRLWP